MNGMGAHALEVLGRAVPRILAAAAPHGGGPAADDARVVNERRIHGENSKVEANERKMLSRMVSTLWGTSALLFAWASGCFRVGQRRFSRCLARSQGSRRYVNDRRC